ncbi:MAG: hypothetical protein HS111_38045 [Kofleriaceae bacterium]|nr:hypothetical protein [Kofleriaceae bacterium]MBE7454453.1 hypothetical protein [Kofleriaceae bacterium]MCL4228640.1 hypothetical protein [Myxococcales bacterium]
MRDLVLIAATVAALLVVVTLLRALAARGRRRTARRRARVALAGEARAEALLADAGFAVLDRQVAHTWQIAVDDDVHEAALRCDFLVARDGQRWVAEVKTGDLAPSLTTTATRRQLLEYQVAYAAAGVALVDATAGTVREVRFELPRQLAPAAD